MQILDYLPDSVYLKGDNYKLYSYGNLTNGMYYRVSISRKHNLVCYVYRPDKTVYATAIVGSEDYEKLCIKISNLCKNCK